MDELNELEAEAAGNELAEMEIGSGHIQNKNPGQMIHGKPQSEEDELKALEAMMS